MKKTAKVIAVAAACACLLGASGCATANNHISVDSFWYIDSYEGIQRTAVLDDAENAGRTPEVLLYELKFDKESGGNAAYYVEYFTDDTDFENGEHPHYFKTTFYAMSFDWNGDLVNEDYRISSTDEIPEEDRARMNGTEEVVYVLETEMRADGQYVYGPSDTEPTADNSVQFSDYIKTTTYFRSARNTLEPVYSRQEVHTTTPASLSPASKDDMCTQIEYVYEVSYNFGCTEATYTYTEEGGESEEHTVSGLQDTGYTMFDNNSLYTAIRGMSLSDSFSATISLFIPANFGILNASVTGGAQGELSPTDDADIISALTAAYGEPEVPDSGEDDSSEDETAHSYIYYNPVSITAASTLHGTTQTAWFAAVSDEDNNTYRATMLRLAVPISYGLGTMEYRLSEVVSVLGELAQ